MRPNSSSDGPSIGKLEARAAAQEDVGDVLQLAQIHPVDVAQHGMFGQFDGRGVLVLVGVGLLLH